TAGTTRPAATAPPTTGNQGCAPVAARQREDHSVSDHSDSRQIQISGNPLWRQIRFAVPQFDGERHEASVDHVTVALLEEADGVLRGRPVHGSQQPALALRIEVGRYDAPHTVVAECHGVIGPALGLVEWSAVI